MRASRGTPTRSEGERTPRNRIEVAHVVIHDNARSGYRDIRSKCVAQTGEHVEDIPCAVGDGECCGVMPTNRFCAPLHRRRGFTALVRCG